MKFNILTRAVAALALVLAPMAGPAGAAGSTPAGIRGAEASFSRVTGDFEQLRSLRTLTGRDIDTPMDQSYASGMYDTFNQATSAASLAATSKGAKGDVQGLKLFEDLAEVHEKALSREQEENDQFMGRIRSGEVTIDPKLVASWPVRDQQAFKAFLSPGAVKAYPSLARLAAIPQDPPRQMAALGSVTQCSVAIPCISPCYNQQWTACATCIAKAVGTAKSAWSQYQSCKGGAGKPRWMPLRIWQAQCLVKFIAVLA